MVIQFIEISNIGGEEVGMGEDGVIMGDSDFEVFMKHSIGHAPRHWTSGSGAQKKGPDLGSPACK